MLRQFNSQRKVVFFLYDWSATLLALALAARLRLSMGQLPPAFQEALFSAGVEVGGASGIIQRGGGVAFPIFAAVAFIWPFFLVNFSAYDGRRTGSRLAELWNVMTAVVVSTIALCGILFFSYRETSRVAILIFFLLDLLLLLGGRLAFYMYRRAVSKNGKASRRIVMVVGAGVVGVRTVGELRKYAASELHLAGFLDDDPRKREMQPAGLQVLGTLDDVTDVVARYGVQDAVIALPLQAHERMTVTCAALQRLGVRVYVIPDLFALSFPNAALEGFGGIPVIDLGQPGMRGWRRSVKRVFDTAIALVGLLIMSPLLALVALVIKLDSPGPVLYGSTRVGEGGRAFKMLKFRSMYVNNDSAIHQQYVARLIQQNLTAEQVAKETGQKSLKMEADPRITRVGRFIRKTSIDELPQIFNVLRGEMSLVGPRPPLPYEVEMYQEWHKRRFEAIPGITGLWQVKGRNRVSFDEMVRMDIEYIERQSLWLDIFLILQTPWALISARGAG